MGSGSTLSKIRNMINKISAVIITKNEERNIERCLESLEGITDEIIVVDSFSTDSTEDICKKYNVKFVQQEFVDYSISKNYGNSLSSFPFILSLDADEEVSVELKKSILDVKADLKADGYHFNRKTNYCGQWINHCGWYPDTKLRLFRKTKASWKGKVHETLELEGSSKFLKGDILHYSFTSIEGHVKKLNKYAEMAALELFERQKKASVIKIAFAPPFEFFKKYFIQRGFLDGFYGFVICKMSAYYKFYKYAKLKDLWIRREN